jgi:hypothetical protein
VVLEQNAKKDHLRLVNNIAVQGPVYHTGWSKVPLTSSKQDRNLESYPHIDAMVVKANIAAWDISRILVDTGSSTDIIFANTFNQMKFSRNQLQPPNTPLIGLGGRRVDALRNISLPVSFVNQENARIEYI